MSLADQDEELISRSRFLIAAQRLNPGIVGALGEAPLAGKILLKSVCCLLMLSTTGHSQQEQAQQEQARSSPQGIYAARLDTKTGHLSPLGLQVELERATWLVTHPSLPVIYTVADSGGGLSAESNIHSFAVDPASGTLTQERRRNRTLRQRKVSICVPARRPGQHRRLRGE